MRDAHCALAETVKDKIRKPITFSSIMKTKLNVVSPTEKESVATPKRAKIQEDGIPSLDTLCSDLLSRFILPFVGKNQYRFVGAVNRHFRSVYKELFSSTSTFHHVATVDQANVCFHDIKEQSSLVQTLCKVMVQQNNKTALKFLFSEDELICENPQMATTAVKEGNFDLLKWLIQMKCSVDVSTTASAAAYNDLSMLMFLRTLPNCPWDETTCSTAALHGHLNVLKYARKNGCQWDTKTCSNAAGNGHFHILKFARYKGCDWNSETCAMAALNGHLEVLEWVLPGDCPCDISVTCENAAMNGHLNVVRFMHEYFEVWNVSIAVKAAEFGHWNVAEWALSQGLNVDDICNIAAEKGDLVMLQKAHTIGCPIGSTTMMKAAKMGYLEILKWLHSNGCPWESSACTYAAMNGHIEVLKYLRTNGCPWDCNTMDAAVEGGHLEVVRWARANGCDWWLDTSGLAGLHGSLSILQFLLGNGCPWDEDLIGGYPAQKGYLHILEWLHSNSYQMSDYVCTCAAEFGHLDVLQWARSHDIEWSDDVYSLASLNGDLEMLNWALANGCPWGKVYECFSNAFKNNHRKVLRWLIANGCPWSTETCAEAASRGDFALLRWLHENFCPWDESTCANAAEKGHREILRWARLYDCQGSVPFKCNILHYFRSPAFECIPLHKI